MLANEKHSDKSRYDPCHCLGHVHPTLHCCHPEAKQSKWHFMKSPIWGHMETLPSLTAAMAGGMQNEQSFLKDTFRASVASLPSHPGLQEPPPQGLRAA